jgi:hypothetical protein
VFLPLLPVLGLTCQSANGRCASSGGQKPPLLQSSKDFPQVGRHVTSLSVSSTVEGPSHDPSSELERSTVGTFCFFWRTPDWANDRSPPFFPCSGHTGLMRSVSPEPLVSRRVGAPTAPRSRSQAPVGAKLAQQGHSPDAGSWSVLESSPFHVPGIGSVMTSANTQYFSSAPETTGSFPALESFRVPELCRILVVPMLRLLGWARRRPGRSR